MEQKRIEQSRITVYAQKTKYNQLVAKLRLQGVKGGVSEWFRSKMDEELKKKSSLSESHSNTV